MYKGAKFSAVATLLLLGLFLLKHALQQTNLQSQTPPILPPSLHPSPPFTPNTTVSHHSNEKLKWRRKKKIKKKKKKPGNALRIKIEKNNRERIDSDLKRQSASSFSLISRKLSRDNPHALFPRAASRGCQCSVCK